MKPKKEIKKYCEHRGCKVKSMWLDRCAKHSLCKYPRCEKEGLEYIEYCREHNDLYCFVAEIIENRLNP